MRNRLRRKTTSAWRKLLTSVKRLDPTYTIEQTFHTHHYLRLTMRTLEHLASMDLPVRNRSVLEVGAGVGDFSSFFLDRACRTTITDVRPELLTYLQRRYPGQDIRCLDLEQPTSLADAPFEVVFCYGVLYHLQHPAQAIAYLSDCCSDLMLVSSQVIYGDEEDFVLADEQQARLGQSYYGCGARFTRRWLWQQLRQHFPHVYLPIIQPAHPQFPTNWMVQPAQEELARAIFVAARQPLTNPLLTEAWLDRQEHQR
ncbi:class I SAM-dependent methyltransferase [Candidatus Chloroploca sp. M-50]|uniref:Class I SAM-dependent methyltransferase n=1 Tax=Candidatus Chloroploca mongolica TaxID=2528176 RepID=A0ABS4D471_9CHLR|nr:methyltransferase domain-containing protein [Candidatus Chloroploca mongolica]MBP1464237.1 class I SAM-dependent methyltransferase [Candidatus Chloroploca mongolica]